MALSPALEIQPARIAHLVDIHGSMVWKLLAHSRARFARSLLDSGAICAAPLD